MKEWEGRREEGEGEEKSYGKKGEVEEDLERRKNGKQKTNRKERGKKGEEVGEQEKKEEEEEEN